MYKQKVTFEILLFLVISIFLVFIISPGKMFAAETDQTNITQTDGEQPEQGGVIESGTSTLENSSKLESADPSEQSATSAEENLDESQNADLGAIDPSAATELRLDEVQFFPFQTVTGFSFKTFSEKPLLEIYTDFANKVGAIYSSTISPNSSPDYSMISNGFFISADGYFLTTYRHIREAFNQTTKNVKPDLSLKLLTNQSLQLLDLDLINVCEETDLVLFKADLASIGINEIPFVELAGNVEYNVGQPLIGIGFPEIFSREGSLYPGFLMEIGIAEVSEQNFSMQKLKSSAVIPNNLNGCLIVNSSGQAVGISSIDQNRSLNDRYTIVYPAEQIQLGLNRMFNSINQEPKTSLGLVFVSDYDYEKMRTTFGLPEGLYISKVLVNGQAYVSDIRKGDILTSLGGVPIASVEHYFEIIDNQAPGDSVRAVIYRPRLAESIEKTLYID